MKELETAIVASFRKIAETGKLEELIENKLTNTIGSIIDDLLRSYSDFGKELSKYLKDALHVDLNQLGLVGYNEIILQIIKRKIDSSINTIGKERIEKDLDDLLKNPPAEIKLSELVEELKKEDIDHSYGGECTCIVEWSDTSIDNNKFCYIYLDEESKPRDKRYSCDYHLSIHPDGTVYNVSIKGRDGKDDLFMGKRYGFERCLFQLYAAKSRLVIDEDDVYTSYENDD